MRKFCFVIVLIMIGLLSFCISVIAANDIIMNVTPSYPTAWLTSHCNQLKFEALLDQPANGCYIKKKWTLQCEYVINSKHIFVEIPMSQWDDSTYVEIPRSVGSYIPEYADWPKLHLWLGVYEYDEKDSPKRYDTFEWSIIYDPADYYSEGGSGIVEGQNFYFEQTVPKKLVTSGINFKPYFHPVENAERFVKRKEPYKISVHEYSNVNGAKEPKEFTVDPPTGEYIIDKLNMFSYVTLEYSLDATIHNAYGLIVPVSFKKTYQLDCAQTEWNVLHPRFTNDYGEFYMQPGKQISFSLIEKDPDVDMIWHGAGVSLKNSDVFTFTKTEASEDYVECIYEKAIDDPNSNFYKILVGSTILHICKIEHYAGPSIDYLSCKTPYDLGNGVTLDLKTGDVKISQTDLVLPGRDGLDLRLTRVYSYLSNHIGTRYSMLESGIYASSNPGFAPLKELEPTSESILTEPMNGWSYDFPRITSYYIYCDGKLYPNCLNADRLSIFSNPGQFYWAQGCEKIGNSYYYRDGNFRVTANSDDSVTLTKADGTSYIFPCEKEITENEPEQWAYRPLARIEDQLGNQINFKYYEDYRVTITDSVGRIIDVWCNVIFVDGIPIVTFSHSYDDNSDTIIDSIIDANGRATTITKGSDYLDMTSPNGEKTHLQFGFVDGHVPSCGYYPTEYLLSGVSRGKEFSINYEFMDGGNYNDWDNYIKKISITHGIETVTANLDYQSLEMVFGEYDHVTYMVCPGPTTLSDNHNSYHYAYEQHSFGYSGSNTPPINNQLNLLSLVDVTGPQSYTRSFTYDDKFRLSSETGPDGTVEYTYHTIDNANTYFSGIGSITHGNLKTSYDYDELGRLTSVTEGDANPVEYTYNDLGNVVKVTDPKGNVTSITYDDTYQLFPTNITAQRYPDRASAEDRSVIYEYFYPFGWLKSQTYGPDTTSYTYDAIGRLLTTIDSRGTVTTQYDDTNLLETTTDYEGNVAQNTYDPLGRLSQSQVNDKLGLILSKINYAYDPQYDFRIQALTRDGEGAQTFSYDDSNNKVTVTDADGNTTTTNYDALGRVAQVNDLSGTTTYSYSGTNGLLSQVNQAGQISKNYTYNSRGLVTAIGYGDGKTEAVGYDDNDNSLTIKDRSGKTLSYEYNRFNAITAVKNGTDTIATYTYDNLGRVLTASSPGMAYQNYYDDKGYLTHTTQTIKNRLYDLYFTYGPYDRISEMTLKDANGQVLTKFGYDYNSPNSSVSALVQGNLVNFATAIIGAGSRITEQRFANGLGLNYTYDARLRIQNRTATINGGLLQTHNYTYDNSSNNGNGAIGNIVQIDNQTFDYYRDPLTGKFTERLTQTGGGLKNIAYAYDPDNGYRTQVTKDGVTSAYTYDGSRLIQAGNVSYTYTTDGSRATKTSGTDQWNYTYDNLGRLSQVSCNNNPVGSYGYDLDGWRIWKEENGKTTVYVRYNDQVIYQETFNGTSVDRYTTPESKRAFVYLGDELVGTVINGTEARYYVNDHLGTTELVTDANGNIISRIEHTPFGEAVQVQSGTATSDGSEDYFFTGKEKDATGLYYFGGRYYDPEIGQFISEDPGQDGVNWYSYCRNNPVSYFDPDGWYTSPWYLRSTVPGQTAWDNALTALENRRYGEAVAWTGMMLGEQFMFVWTLGESQAALRAGAIGTKAVGSTATRIISKSASKTGNQLISIYRAVGPDEFYSVMKSGKFNVIPNGLQAKQFGLSLEETLKFANKYSDIGAIIEVKIPINILRKIGDFTHVDRFLFKNGTITIHLDKLVEFNNVIQQIIHRF